jgi:hypothetical protein
MGTLSLVELMSIEFPKRDWENQRFKDQLVENHLDYIRRPQEILSQLTVKEINQKILIQGIFSQKA